MKYEIHFTEMFHQFLPEIDEDKKIILIIQFILSDKTNIIESIPINKSMAASQSTPPELFSISLAFFKLLRALL